MRKKALAIHPSSIAFIMSIHTETFLSLLAAQRRLAAQILHSFSQVEP
jgi:hypothetical protein